MVMHVVSDPTKALSASHLKIVRPIDFCSIYTREITSFRTINKRTRTSLLTSDEEKLVFDLYKKSIDSSEKESDLSAKSVAKEIESFVVRIYYPSFVKIASSVVFKAGKKLSSSDKDDLIQEGALRFFNSTLRNFDPSLGSLEKYLQNWVRTAMWRSVGSKLGIFKIGPDMASDIAKIDRFVSDYLAKNQKEPSDEEVANGCNLKISRVKSVFRAKRAQIASPIVCDGEELDWFDFISQNSPTPESTYSDSELAFVRSILLDDLLGILDSQTRSFVERNLGFDDQDPVSVRSLGAQLGISHEAVAKRIRKAMEKLKEEAKKYEVL